MHDIRNVNFSFSDYIKGLKPEQANNLVQAFSYGLRERLLIEEKEIPREEWIMREPRWAVWFSGLSCMSEIAGCLAYVSQNENLDDLKDQLFEKQQEFINVMTKKLNPNDAGPASEDTAMPYTEAQPASTKPANNP